MINYDSRACGQGKTLSGIYPLIESNSKTTKLTLVVVPSVELQLQYQKEFKSAQVINEQLKYAYDSVQKAIYAAVQKQKPLIIITHAAFYELPVSIIQLNNYHLIIDEALEQVIDYSSLDLNKTLSLCQTESMIPLQNLYSFKSAHDTNMEIIKTCKEQEVKMPTEPMQVEINPIVLSALTSDVMVNYSKAKRITHENYDHFISLAAYDSLNSVSRESTTIIHQLKTECITRFKSAHIACANFEQTKMYNWLKQAKAELNCLYEFAPHENFNIILYHPQESFKWSKEKAKTDTKSIKQYRDFVKANQTDKLLALRNNGNSNYFESEEKLSHNTHGLNKTEWMESTSISIESSLNPHPVVKKFITDNWFHGEKNESMINNMFSGSVYYQTIMRSILRTVQYNNEEVRIFCMAHSMALSICSYFTIKVSEVDMRVKEFRIEVEESKKMGRPKLYNPDGTPMTRSDREKAQRQRAKEMREAAK